MEKYTFKEINGSIVIHLEASNLLEAFELLVMTVKRPGNFRYEMSEKEGGEENKN